MAKEKLVGNMLIAQSGGPTVVINQSLVGAVLEAKKHKEIKRIFGSLHGLKGILEENLCDLSKETKQNLELVAQTPSSALGSVRKKPTPEDCVKVFTVLQKYNIRYFFYIGGNDSAETTHIINEAALQAGYQMKCFHICKTIDNDLKENDHTPGFGSAGKFVAQAFMGDNLDNRALPGVKIDVIMGRGAGFLTAASALARVFPGDGPHLIYIPERPFSLAKFVADVQGVMAKQKRCVVAVSEGIVDETGEPIASKFISEVDSHGNKQLSGSGALGDALAKEIKEKAQISRVRSDTFGYLQRSFCGVVSAVDAKEARLAGTTAVKFATGGKFDNGSTAIKRAPGKTYKTWIERTELRNVAKETRHMPDEFINAAGNDVTPAFLKYAAPIIGPLPKIGQLKALPVSKK
jgi:6-phosphofructokinase 1